MSTEISLYISAIAPVAAIVFYLIVNKPQLKTIELLKKSLESQSKIIEDFQKWKEFFSPEDFEKRLLLKLDNQKMELNKAFDSKSKLNKLLLSVKECLSLIACGS